MAKRFGAAQAADRSRIQNERQLLNIVAEVSIASTISQPDVFVLHRESSNNAFVLGNSASRPVIVLTQGSLDAFDREQLQAVVAHEVAHITNGDLAVNMRLLITMGGLMAIDEVGRLLMAKRATEFVHPGTFVGGLLCVIGNVGVVVGGLICAAFSRQREYLADATAIQFTHNPFALAAALNVVQEHSHEPALHGIHARELAHLCFHSGRVQGWLNKQAWLRSWFSSHPDVALRIKAIEPHFDVKNRKISRHESKEAVAGVGIGGGVLPVVENTSGIQVVSNDVMSGYASNSAVYSPVHRLSDQILLLLPDATMCLVALFALFVRDDEEERREYLQALSLSFNDEFINNVEKVMQLVPDELTKNQLGAISHISEVLNKNCSNEQRQNIMLKLEQCVSKSSNFNLIDYARIQLIKRKLLIEHPDMSATARDQSSGEKALHIKDFDSMGCEFALLLSLMTVTSPNTDQPPTKLLFFHSPSITVKSLENRM